MKLTVPALAAYLAFSCPAASSQGEISLTAHNWMVDEIRTSEDHWTSREEWSFDDMADGTFLIDAIKVCRTSNNPIIVEVVVRAQIDAHRITILISEDHDSNLGMHSHCSVSVRRGTYDYKISRDGNSVRVRDSKGVREWTRYDPRTDYYDEVDQSVAKGTTPPPASPLKMEKFFALSIKLNE
jgi:hypothetical protein